MERYREEQGNLFNGVNTRDYSDALKQEIHKEIQNLENDKILNVPENEYVNYLIEKYIIECPEMQFNQYDVVPRPALVSSEILPNNFKYAAPEEVERNVYKLCVPFIGDGDILKIRPAAYISVGGSHRFIIGYKEVYVDIIDYSGNGENIKNECQRYLEDLKKMMSQLKKEIDGINQSMPQYIHKTFTARKEKIKKDYDVIANLGIPIRSNASPKTYCVPTVKKRLEIPIERTSLKAEPLIPTMAETDYNAILQVVNAIGKQFERYPKTVQNQDEETIREQFLAQLSVSFPSCSSSGESFNHEGKTDIMVKHGNDILFIAECKIWKGQKKLQDAIEQLLKYLTHRDTKTALLIFNKDTDIDTVIQSIQESIPNHPNFVKQIGQRDKGWFDYTFRLTDSSNEIKMAVMVFDFKK